MFFAVIALVCWTKQLLRYGARWVLSQAIIWDIYCPMLIQAKLQCKTENNTAKKVLLGFMRVNSLMLNSEIIHFQKIGVLPGHALH